MNRVVDWFNAQSARTQLLVCTLVVAVAVGAVIAGRDSERTTQAAPDVVVTEPAAGVGLSDRGRQISEVVSDYLNVLLEDPAAARRSSEASRAVGRLRAAGAGADGECARAILSTERAIGDVELGAGEKRARVLDASAPALGYC